MKQDDQVFFLTLIDFFIQILFFGLFIYAVSWMKPPDHSMDKQSAAIKRLFDHVGVSDYVELTDKLTRLSPAQLEYAVELFRREGAPSQIDKQLELARTVKKEKEGKIGAGKPHCLYDTDEKGNQIARPLAEVIAFEESISFVNRTSELETLLTMLRYDYNDIQSLSLKEFPKKFAQVVVKRPDCLYTLRVYEMTRYVEPRDTIRPFFYTQIRKGPPPP